MTVEDLSSARGCGPRSPARAFGADRAPLPPTESQSQDFCGFEHDLAETFAYGCIRLKPHERLLTKTFVLLWSTLL